MVQHAIASEDKQARRESILNAGSALFLSGDGTLPAVAEIAAKAGLAKGTVYLYFQTKEEIYIALLLQALDTLLSGISQTFQDARGRRADKVSAFLSTHVEYLRGHPELLRLDALGYGVLENNLDEGKLRYFKTTFISKLLETGRVVEEALRLSEGRGSSLLMRTFALTRGLWQSYHPCQEPMLIPLDFNRELIEALTEYWRGALA